MNFHGRARISARHPVAQAICDRCGFAYSRTDLSFQFDYAGAALVNTQFRVCARCKDRPDLWTLGQATALAPDPVPVPYPRPDDPTAMYAAIGIDSGGAVLTDQGFLLVPEDDANAPDWAGVATDGVGAIAVDSGAALVLDVFTVAASYRTPNYDAFATLRSDPPFLRLFPTLPTGALSNAQPVPAVAPPSIYPVIDLGTEAGAFLISDLGALIMLDAGTVPSGITLSYG